MKKAYATYRLSLLCGSQKGREFSIPARLIRKGSDPILNSILERMGWLGKVSFKRGDLENTPSSRLKCPTGKDTDLTQKCWQSERPYPFLCPVPFQSEDRETIEGVIFGMLSCSVPYFLENRKLRQR